jgi:transcriptional regulator with XRE-family HTH domain
VGQTIAERIRIIRVSKRLTQENVADEIGLTHGAYAKIERGETDPNTSRLMDIAKALKVDVTVFFEDSSVPLAKEHKVSYGYASRDEVEFLRQKVDHMGSTMQSILKEMEKIRQEISKSRGKKK